MSVVSESGVPRRPTGMDDPRTEFLIEMYRQTSNHLNRHILLVWQSVALLGGAYAAFAFQEKKIISDDVATSVALLLCGWFCANVYDAFAWFDRNLTIIGNLERLFLLPGDSKLVHPYFRTHRPAGKLILHFRIQLAFGITLAGIILSNHLLNKVLPSFSIPNGVFILEMAMPYIVLLASVAFCEYVRRDCRDKANELREASPGLELPVEAKS